MKKRFLSFLLCLFVSINAHSQTLSDERHVEEGVNGYSELNVEKELVYIDVRTWVEHKINHIDGDPRIHISGLVKGVEKQFPDKSTPIRLYCAKGVRSGRGVAKLKEAGYLDVQNVGGIEDVKKLRFSGAL